MIAAVGQTFTLTCVIKGFDFENYAGGDSLSLEVRDVNGQFYILFVFILVKVFNCLFVRACVRACVCFHVCYVKFT